jgi:hypothetical protein
MAEARNYEQYRRQILDDLGVEYLTEDIEDFTKWRLKVYEGLLAFFPTLNGDMKYISKAPVGADWQEIVIRIPIGSGNTEDVQIYDSMAIDEKFRTAMNILAPSLLPTVTDADDGKVLGVANGTWTLIQP